MKSTRTLGTLAVIVAVIGGACVATLQPTTAAQDVPVRVQCSDFRTQVDAQAALPAHPGLDDDDDGTACESLFGSGKPVQPNNVAGRIITNGKMPLK